MNVSLPTTIWYNIVHENLVERACGRNSTWTGLTGHGNVVGIARGLVMEMWQEQHVDWTNSAYTTPDMSSDWNDYMKFGENQTCHDEGYLHCVTQGNVPNISKFGA